MNNSFNTAHLPHHQMKHTALQHGLSFKLCLESLLSVPRSFVVDGIISYGGATGIGASLPKKAYGEFFERNHFFTSVKTTSYKTLSEIEPLAYRLQLEQLCSFDDELQFRKHAFAFTTVYNLFDQAECDYFVNAISLNGNRDDSAFLKFTDSCACASHPVMTRALHCSLMEFLERQALVGAWLTKRYRYAIEPQVLLDCTPYQSLCDTLLENGQLYIYEINNNLPGYTVLLFYFADSKKDTVRYAVGAKSALCLKTALNGALEELYQCYAFLYNGESTKNQLANKAGSGYHVAFQQFNRDETKNIIPFLTIKPQETINDISALNAMPQVTTEAALGALGAISKNIYYYHEYDPALGLHFTKVLSPAFFAHMSLHRRLNFDNDYAKHLKLDKDKIYTARLPFP